MGVIDRIKSSLADLANMTSIDSDGSLEGEIKEKLFELEREISKEEIKVFLSGKYDKNNALLQIFAGAGGVDAQDWAGMILRMYERYLSSKGFRVTVIDQSLGEVGGIKEATLEVKGSWAFGTLKHEKGVHRLVRNSPFSGKGLRHTSFAMVDILPEIKDKSFEIKPEDLRIETSKSSGPGGQNVNKRETAIRIIHIPTGIAVSSQNERSQAQNKEKAMGILFSKLLAIQEEQKLEEIGEIKGEKLAVAWGNQIRSYVLHPYKMIKDLRTGVEISNVESVLDGDLDMFIESELRMLYKNNN
ncbi:MAG: Peptide chain release factor 2 [Parcubacteria group bacterium ADurb.Bin247]|nr:MAG: Peptide chain release factor 2 [Parcubacteria group bacterium ADurb.Bin247]